MLEATKKTYFPALPFHHPINYLMLKHYDSNTKLNDLSSSKVSNESSEISECELKREDYYSFPNKIDTNTFQTSLDSSYKKKIIKKKSPVKMSEAATNFKLTFYQMFTSRKKFQKKFVVMIHNEICTNLELRRVNREEARSINLYFSHFLNHKDKILFYINKNVNNLRRRLPELNEIPR